MLKKIVIIFLIVLVVSQSHIVFAHGGNTDEDGGHTDHSSGEYHYHHGYPAHQHVNGECPYDFENGFTDTSFSDSSTTKKQQNYSTYEIKTEPTKHREPGVILEVLNIVVTIFLGAFLIIAYLEQLINLIFVIGRILLFIPTKIFNLLKK